MKVSFNRHLFAQSQGTNRLFLGNPFRNYHTFEHQGLIFLKWGMLIISQVKMIVSSADCFSNVVVVFVATKNKQKRTVCITLARASMKWMKMNENDSFQVPNLLFSSTHQKKNSSRVSRPCGVDIWPLAHFSTIHLQEDVDLPRGQAQTFDDISLHPLLGRFLINGAQGENHV